MDTISFGTTRRQCGRAGAWIACLLGAALFATGCRSPHRGGGPKLEAADGIAAGQLPPLFTGPWSVLLTNESDFSAHLVLSETYQGAETAPLCSGNLFQQGAQFLFVPTSDDAARKNPWAGSFRFLWDARRGNGYVLSEALHGYAPLALTTRYELNLASAPAPGATAQTIDDQSCQIFQATVTGSDGSSTPFRLWRATELNNLPIQIVAQQTNAPTVRLSQVKVEAQSAELFSPPDGFARYSSADAMVHEMVRRQMLQRFLPGSGNDAAGRRSRGSR